VPPPDDAAALVQKLIPHVERLRGLTFKRPVAVQVVDEAEAREHFQRRAALLWPAQQVQLDQAAYANLGLVPAGTELLGGLVDAVAEHALGYYDPGSDTFFVLSDVDDTAAPLVFVHELTHALDDQHFGIDSLLRGLEEDDDAASALAAVVEGSGTLVMGAYAVEEMTAGRLTAQMLQKLQQKDAAEAARFHNLPPIFQRSLAAPYVLGSNFLLRGKLSPLRLTVVPEDINRAFRELPGSSEQILHPAKYWDAAQHDPPQKVTLPDLSSTVGKGWALAGRGRLGELMLALLAGARSINLASPKAQQAATWTLPAVTGGAGDTFHHYTRGEQSVTVLLTLWDDPAEALEFQNALREGPRLGSYRFASAVLVVGGDAIERWDTLAPAALSAAGTQADGTP